MLAIIVSSILAVGPLFQKTVIPEGDALLQIPSVASSSLTVYGRGCPVDKGNIVVTAWHVLKDMKKNDIFVMMPSGRKIKASIVYKNEDEDVAALKVDEPIPFSFVVASSLPLIGTPVVTVLELQNGNPTLSFGTFYGGSGPWFEHSAMTGPGSSGSCVLAYQPEDDSWKVIGVSKAARIWSFSGDSPDVWSPKDSLAIKVLSSEVTGKE